jgi:hypothetical protein
MIDSADWGTFEGFDIRAVMVTDDTAMGTSELKEYAPEVLKAYRANDWCHVGVIVTASKAGVELATSSLWGTEYGYFPGVEECVNPLTDPEFPYRADLIEEVITESQKMIGALNG